MRGRIAAAIALALTAPAHSEPYLSTLGAVFDRYPLSEQLKPGFVFEPRVESALQFIGNINLAQESSKEVDLAGIEFVPGLLASYNTARGRGFLDYSFVGRVWEDSDYNAATHRLLANGNYWLVPDWFLVSGQASYGDTIIDPLISYNYGSSGLFNRSNIAERATASITPAINHDFRDFNFYASYTYGRVWYLDNRDVPESPVFTFFKDNSRDQRAFVQISSRDPGNQATLKVFYEWQASDFERTVPYRYERVGTDLGFRLSRTLRLVADAGLESDLDKSTVAGGLDSEFWHAGLRWTPDSRTTVEGRYGQRFYGDAWRFLVERDTRFVTIRLSYTEDPDIETRRVGINFDPDEIPLPPQDDPTGITSYPYIRKDAIAALIAEGARTRLRFELYDRKREYLTSLRADTDIQGVRFNGVRDLGSDFYAELDTYYSDSKRGVFVEEADGFVDPETGEYFFAQSYDWTIKGRLTWELYSNLYTAAEVGYLQRRGTRTYDGEWLAFRVRYTF